MPYIKFIAGEINRQYKMPDGSFKRQNRLKWRKDGEKGFTWERSLGLLSISRDSVLEDNLKIYNLIRLIHSGPNPDSIEDGTVSSRPQRPQRPSCQISMKSSKEDSDNFLKMYEKTLTD